MKRAFALDEDTIQLPNGTRVIMRTDVCGPDDYLHKRGSIATVEEVFYNTYTLVTPTGRRFEVQRDQIKPQRTDLLETLGRRTIDYEHLREHVMYSATVGSQAWGLADEHSDEDVRGWFVLPFDELVGIWQAPDEIHEPDSDAAFWEVGKLVHQGLRGDANTLETLWSPLHGVVQPLGRRLLDQRGMFVSMNILGSFGRYAQSQFRKIERSLTRNAATRELLDALESGRVNTMDAAIELLNSKDELKAVCRSAYDRGLIPSSNFDALAQAIGAGRRADLEPPTFRPKNAYNLLRLLHSCVSWMKTGEPLIEVTGALRDRLLAIKRQEVQIEQVLADARELAGAVDEAAAVSQLPPEPDFEAADAFLRECRRASTRTSHVVVEATLVTDTLPEDVDTTRLHDFLERYEDLPILWVALTGSHAYGFPSPDSDLDIKSVHAYPAEKMLGLSEPNPTVQFLGDVDGREYDFTSNEAAMCADGILKGNGNFLERMLGPIAILTTPAGFRLRELAQANLSRRVLHHYNGFFTGIRKEYEREAKRGVRKAKRLLYCFRVALTGLHALRTAAIVTNVVELAQEYGLQESVDALVKRKSLAELQTLSEAEAKDFLPVLDALQQRLQDAVGDSVLPDEPAHVADLERWLLDVRFVRV